MSRRGPLALGATLLLSLSLLGASLSACAGSAPGGVHARFGYSEAHGLRVVEVPAGPAAEAGLEVGDRIITVDGEPVRNLAMSELVERLRGRVGTTVELEVQREDELIPLVVRRAPYEHRD